MKQLLKIFSATLTLFVWFGIESCAQSGSTSLNPTDFSSKISTPGAVVLDVRTPSEFEKGHIAQARNVDWNSENFANDITGIDKNAPVLVYCLSGARSASAAKFLRKKGFSEVYELEGGIMKWRGAGLPESLGKVNASQTLTHEQFQQLLKSDKLVLVDFYADWCGPCKKMKPHLDALAAEYSDRVEVIRINADDNRTLLQTLRVDELPTLYLYKNEQITSRHIGFIDKAGLLEMIK